jgi:malonate-semialdehyde dehydrogenase (acetylating)/methylmalonate-semialdehyde dehydrogenase
MSAAQVQTVKLFLNGEFVDSRSARSGPVFNPSTGEQIASCPFCTAAETAGVIEAAQQAFPAWRDKPVVERVRVLFRLVALMEKSAKELARTISLEHGKTREEALGSVRRGIEMVEFACGMPTFTMGATLQNLAQDVDCETYYHPLGVCVGITPLNFPLMVPLWMMPLAVAAGNTFVLKPSEKVPLSVMRVAQLTVEAGFPKGVFNVVHGDKECVDALLTHPLVQAVSFVGSTSVAAYIYETATRHGKRCQANGGAKNHVVVMPDADIERASAALQFSAFGCSGQRCMAGPLAVAVGNAGDAIVEAMIARANKMRVGPTDRDWGADMGPVTTRQHLDNLRVNIDKGLQEGAKLIRDGRSVRIDEAPHGFYLGPTIFDQVHPEMFVSRTELFGPVLSVTRVSDLDRAIELTHKSPYGNGAVIFTQSGRAAREFKHRAGAGMIGINIGVPAPMAMFPFSGHKASFFGDLHIQGQDGIRFYTKPKMVLSRWHPESRAGEFVTTRG